jgi:hypothetical protein
MLTTLFIFLITLAVAYIVGITIVGLVDKRLDRLSIQLPEQWNINETENDKKRKRNNRNVPGLEEWDEINNKFNNRNDEYEKVMKIARDMKHKREFENNLKSNMLVNNVMSIDNDISVSSASLGNEEHFSNLTPSIVDKQCSLDIGNNKIEPTKNTMYPYEPVNYPHPKLMSKNDFNTFKESYHPRMTKQDYYNWLGAFDTDGGLNSTGNDLEKLKNIGEIHYDNLIKLKKQIKEKNIENKIGYDFQPFDDLCNDNTGIMPPLYKSSGVIPKSGPGIYPHLACPFMSYDIKDLIGYNFKDYSEFR